VLGFDINKLKADKETYSRVLEVIKELKENNIDKEIIDIFLEDMFSLKERYASVILGARIMY
jgi:hypothetical protein